MAQTAVVIVDMQEEWRMEPSPFHLGRISLTTKKARTLAHEAFQRDIPVIYTKRFMDDHPEDAFEYYDERSNLIDSMPGQDRAEIVDHQSWNPFIESRLLDALINPEPVEHVVVAGLTIDAGVRSAAEHAYDLDFDVTVVEDCSHAVSSERMQTTLETIQDYRDINIALLKDFRSFLY